MPQALLSREDLLDRLLLVFRDRGFEGATIAEIARATGLGKASLYHHFPGGKVEMAETLVREVCAHLDREVFAVLKGKGSPSRRVQRMVKGLDQYLDGGHSNCLIGIFSLGTMRNRFGEAMSSEVHGWIDQIADVLMEAALSRKRARRRARDFLIRIQGAIVISRALGTVKPYRQTIKHASKALLAGA